MKKILQFFAILGFFVFAQNVHALTLLPSCQNKACVYDLSYIKLENTIDNDSSSDNRGKVISNFTNYREITISWDILKKISSDKSPIKYRFSYGCSPAPDVDNINGTIETTNKSIVFEIPKKDLTANCFCKVWVSVRNKDSEDFKLGGANSRPFQVCANPPKIVLPVLQTQKAVFVKSSSKELFTFNGKLIDLGNDSVVQTYFKIGIKNDLLKEGQKSFIFIKDPQKKYLSGPFNYSTGATGLEMSSKNSGYCYRIEGSNRAGVASGGTRCYPKDDVLIKKPFIQSIDYSLDTKIEKLSSTENREVRLLKTSFIVSDIGNSSDAIAQNWVDTGNGQFVKFGEINNIEAGKEYYFSNVSVGENFKYKIAVINEDGKDVKQENVSLKKYNIGINKIDPQNANNVILSGVFDDEVKPNGVGFVNIVKYYAKIWRNDGKESISGFCPSEFQTIEYTPSFKIFSINIATNANNFGRICSFEPNVKYNVQLVAKYRYIKNRNDVIEVFSDIKDFIFAPKNPDLTAEISNDKKIITIQPKVKQNNGNVLIGLSYLVRPFYPGDKCMELSNIETDDMGLIKKYNISDIVKESIPTIDITKPLQPILVPINLSNRVYCVLLQAYATDSSGHVVGDPFIFSRTTIMTDPMPPVVHLLDIGDDDKTWGGANVKAIIDSTGLDTDEKEFDGKIDDEASKAKVKFIWNYRGSDVFYDLNYYSESRYQKSKDQSGEVIGQVNQFDLTNPQKARDYYVKNIALKDNKICVIAKAENQIGLINNQNFSEQKCFDALYKPEIEPIGVYSLGGDRILVKGTIMKKGGAKEDNIGIIIKRHQMEGNTKCGGNIEIPISKNKIDDGVDTSKMNDGDTFQYILNLSKYWKLPANESCSFVFGTSIGLNSKNVVNNNDNTQKTIEPDMLPFSTYTIGTKLPKEYQQEDYSCLASEGCSTTVFMDLMHFWYFNNKSVRSAYNKFIKTNENSNSFTATNFLDIFYGNKCSSCGAGSILQSLSNAKIPLKLKIIGQGMTGISHDVDDKRSYNIREGMLRLIYDDALSKGYPVGVRTMRNGSQHFFVVRGIYFNTDNGAPNRDKNGEIIFNDFDKIYISDTYNNTNSVIKKSDKINGWYIFKNDFLGDYRCLTNDAQNGYYDGSLTFAYYFMPADKENSSAINN